MTLVYILFGFIITILGVHYYSVQTHHATFSFYKRYLDQNKPFCRWLTISLWEIWSYHALTYSFSPFSTIDECTNSRLSKEMLELQTRIKYKFYSNMHYKTFMQRKKGFGCIITIKFVVVMECITFQLSHKH